ncbi:MAG: GGDEF domain-containing protein [Sulfurovum sp.]|nr:GGDEF domain-containing protein [Sulfurovum sp.]
MNIDKGNKQEKRHALSHLFVVVLMTLGLFVFVNISNENENSDYFILKILCVTLFIFSVFHYFILIKFPYFMSGLRKSMLLLFDVIVLTFGIFFLGEEGIYLLPLYVLIVMESGVSFGWGYVFFTLSLSFVSWGTLWWISLYWVGQEKVLLTFAMITLVIPFVYLKRMRQMYQTQESLHESLISTNYEANYDTLTGLANRKHYDVYMMNLLKEKAFFALLFIDLNKFKVINDTHGHDVGDEVLIEVARRLKSSLDEGDMLARLGGDEFVIITKRKKAFLAKFIEKLEQVTIGRHQIRKVSVLIELSIGISLFPDDSKSETFLRKYADEAMYVAKKAEGEYHVFYADLPKNEYG